LSGITMGQYLPGQSLMHRLDPRAKLTCAALALPAVFLADNPAAMGLLSVWTVLVLVVSRIRPGVYWRSLRALWLLLLVSFIIQVLFTPGEPLFSYGFVKISGEGLANSGWLLWRLALLMLVAAALTFTTTPLQLASALEWLLAPLARVKVPVRELAMVVNLALRLVPTLFDEARYLLMAQRSRGADFTRGSVRERAQRLVPFMVPLLINIFNRADELALAMELRGYRVGAVRSRMHELRFGAADYVAMLVCALILAFITVQRIF